MRIDSQSYQPRRLRRAREDLNNQEIRAAAEAYFDAERENSAEQTNNSENAEEVEQVRNLPNDPLDWEYIQFRRAQIENETNLRNPSCTPEKVKSIFDFESLIPAIWHEELLCDEMDTSMAVAILESYGPITLQMYNRCMELAGQYMEMKDLRSMFLTAAAIR